MSDGPKRHRARRGEGERLRDQILDAAERLMLKTGDPEDVSIRAIADAVGVTPPSIYLHFADKDALIWDVCERAFVRLAEVTDAAAESADDPIASLRAVGKAYVEFGLANPEQYRVMFMSRPARMPEDYDFATAPGFASMRRVAQDVERCMRMGLFRRGDPFETTLLLWTCVHGITSALLSTPHGFPWPQDREKLIDAALDTQLRGLQAATARPRRPAARPRVRR